MPQLQAKDIIAIIMLVGSFGLRALGVNSFTEYLILLVAAGYGLVAIRAHIKKG